jgi:hypothetical protein
MMNQFMTGMPPMGGMGMMSGQMGMNPMGGPMAGGFGNPYATNMPMMGGGLGPMGGPMAGGFATNAPSSVGGPGPMGG